MFEKTVAVAALGIALAACGTGTGTELLDTSKMSPARAYLFARAGLRDPQRIIPLEVEHGEPERPGPHASNLGCLVVLADGSVVYLASDHIERFDASGTKTVVREGCERGLLVAMAVHPDSQTIVYGCSEIGGPTEIFEEARHLATCPSGQFLVAAGINGSLLCDRAIISAEGTITPFELGEGTITAVRARDDGGFLIVTSRGTEKLHAVRSDGAVDALGEYPSLPASIVSNGSLSTRKAALLEDGTYYQLAVPAGPRGPQELYRQRLGETAATSLSDRIGTSALDSLRLATGP